MGVGTYDTVSTRIDKLRELLILCPVGLNLIFRSPMYVKDNVIRFLFCFSYSCERGFYIGK